MANEPEARRFTKDEVLAVAGDWMLLAGPDGDHQFATKVAGLDPADCPVALLMARATGEGITLMARELLGKLAEAGHHVTALCIIEDYFAKAREGGLRKRIEDQVQECQFFAKDDPVSADFWNERADMLRSLGKDS